VIAALHHLFWPPVRGERQIGRPIIGPPTSLRAAGWFGGECAGSTGPALSATGRGCSRVCLADAPAGPQGRLGTSLVCVKLQISRIHREAPKVQSADARQCEKCLCCRQRLPARLEASRGLPAAPPGESACAAAVSCVPPRGPAKPQLKRPLVSASRSAYAAGNASQPGSRRLEAFPQPHREEVPVPQRFLACHLEAQLSPS
jgi:hypothetical protein